MLIQLYYHIHENYSSPEVFVLIAIIKKIATKHFYEFEQKEFRILKTHQTVLITHELVFFLNNHIRINQPYVVIKI